VFIIRKSESKLNFYAISIRVPKYINETEISHYLIEKTNKFYKIHGSDKTFTNLTALVTHCSLVRDILPIILNLRYYQQNDYYYPSSSSSSFIPTSNSLETICSTSSSDW
jgi:hypothetical protein